MTSPEGPSSPVRVQVDGPAPYEVVIGRGLRESVISTVSGASGVCVVYPQALADPADELLTELHGAGLTVSSIGLPDGESAKTLESLDRCWSTFAAAHLDRQGMVVAFGGGTITDLAGFAAATWMRGIPVVQVPTTLLAMVDAAVGGKTGINTAAGKNMVGAFHEPRIVIADLDMLLTLPHRDLVAGMAEVIKCGFIFDTEILRLVEADPAAATDPAGVTIAELVRRAVAVKAAVVAADLKEEQLREILNYGHTLAHAIEKREDYRWRHGDAVAVGCVFAAELAVAAGQLDRDAADRHRRVLELVGLPTSYDRGAFAELVEYMGSDKKVRRGQLRFVTLRALGDVTRLEHPDPQLLQRAWDGLHASR